MSELPKVTYYVAASLDGFIAPPDGSVDWLTCVETEGEDYGYAHFLATVDGLLMGRATYDQVVAMGAWPYEQKPCWVWTHRALDASGAGAPAVRATRESPQAIVAEALRGGSRHLWLVGGGELAALFRDLGLVSKLIVSMIPVLLGDGVPLFGARKGVDSPDRLELEEARTFASGVTQLAYRVRPTIRHEHNGE